MLSRRRFNVGLLSALLGAQSAISPAGTRAELFDKAKQGNTWHYRLLVARTKLHPDHSLAWTLPEELLRQALLFEVQYTQVLRRKSLLLPHDIERLTGWVEAYNSSLGKPILSVTFSRNGNSYELKYHSDAARYAFEQQYNYLRRQRMHVLHLGIDDKQFISIDYSALAQKYKSLAQLWLSSVINAIPGFYQWSIRQQISYLTTRVQLIPYQTDSDRYRLPPTVLHENRADCDEKSLWLAMLLKALPLSPKAMLMHIEDADRGADHMIVFVELQPLRHEQHIVFKGTPLVPIETTKKRDIGSTSPVIGKRILEGRYQLVEVK